MAPTAESENDGLGTILLDPGLSRGDDPNNLGDNIGHIIADLLVHRSDRTGPADDFDDHEWISEPRDHGPLASRRNKSRCRNGRLLARGLISPDHQLDDEAETRPWSRPTRTNLSILSNLRTKTLRVLPLFDLLHLSVQLWTDSSRNTS